MLQPELRENQSVLQAQFLHLLDLGPLDKYYVKCTLLYFIFRTGECKAVPTKRPPVEQN